MAGQKTREEKDKHNLACVKSRKKKKREFEELKNVVAEIVPELKQGQAAHAEMKSKLENKEKELRINFNTLQAAYVERTSLYLGALNIIADQKFTSVEEAEAWFLSRNYVSRQVAQGAGSSSVANVRLPIVAPNIHDHNREHFTPYPAADPNYTDMTASAAAAVNNLSFGSGVPINHLTSQIVAGGPINFGAGSSSVANDCLHIVAPNIHDHNIDHSARYPAASTGNTNMTDFGAGSSVANDLPSASAGLNPTIIHDSYYGSLSALLSELGDFPGTP